MINTISTNLYYAAMWAKEKVWPTTVWSMEAYLDNYAVITVYEEAMDAYISAIYHLDGRKRPLTASRVQYRSLSREDAKLMHYLAMDKALRIETKRICYSTLEWIRRK